MQVAHRHPGHDFTMFSVSCEPDSDVSNIKTQLTTNGYTRQSYTADADAPPVWLKLAEFAHPSVLTSRLKILSFCLHALSDFYFHFHVQILVIP